MKKSALIFTASFGHGHVQAARALKAECEKNDVHTAVIDLLYELPPQLRKFLTFSYYQLLIYAPSIWRKLYEQKGAREVQFLHKILSYFMQGRLNQCIQEHDPDFIISTHPFVTIMLASVKQKMTEPIPLYAVMTDFKFHPFFLHSKIDHYFTADPDFQVESQALGINVGNMTYSGIPAQRFDATHEPIVELIAHHEPMILIAGGGQGLMHYKTLIQALNQLQQKVTIVCMIGRKLKLEASINRLKRNSKHRLLVVPFTDHFSSYLQAASVIITKAGGLTLTEGLLCEKPMLIFKPLPGHEEDNAKFFLEAGVCEWTDQAKKVPELIERLLKTQSHGSPRNKAIHALKKPAAAETIIKTIIAFPQKNVSHIANEASFFDKDGQSKQLLSQQAKQVK